MSTIRLLALALFMPTTPIYAYTSMELQQLLAMGEPQVAQIIQSLNPVDRQKVHVLCEQVRRHPASSGRTKVRLCEIERRTP